MRSHKPIRAVTFDVGGTLIEPWPSVGHVYAAVACEFGIPSIAPEALNQRFGVAWKQRGDFDYSLRSWRAVVNDTFAGLAATGPDEACFHALYRRFGQGRSWRVFPDARPVLSSLRSRGLKLGVISNWDERLRPLLEELELASGLDAIVVSHDVACLKPAPEIFARAARLLGVDAGAIVHVGDSIREDVEGARAAGLQSMFLDRQGDSNPQPGTLSTLADLESCMAGTR